MKYAKIALLLTAVSGGLQPSFAQSQGAVDAYPAKPVTIIIPFAPAGSTELEFRIYANKLTEQVNRPFLLDFKAGAGTLVGTSFVAKAPADGYTLLGTTSSYAALPSLYPDLPYDPIKDMAPVSLMTEKSSLYVIHPSVPARNVQELIKWARATPGKLTHATSGAGGAPHLNAEYFYKLTNITPTFVHYKGTGPMTIDLVAGRVEAVITLPALVMPHIRSGKLIALAGTAASRNVLLPDVPTIMEQGVAGYDYSAWAGMLAPGRTPGAVISKLQAELAKAAKSLDVIKKLGDDGNEMVASTPELFRKRIISDIEMTRRMVKETGIKLE